MNSTMNKKQKLRQNSLAPDFNAREEDFILVDLDVMLDEAEPPPVPLNHFLDDEETIDRLLINTGFDVHIEQEDDRESGALVFDDINRTDDFSGFDRFIVKPIELTEQNLLTEIEEISNLDIHSMADFDQIPDEEDAIDRLLVDAGFDANDKLKEDDRALKITEIDRTNRTEEFGVCFEEPNFMATDAVIFDLEENELVFDKEATGVFWVKEENPENTKQESGISETTYPEEILESLNNDAGITILRAARYEQEKIKKQINNYENKVKKAALVTYISLGFGIVALLSALVMGVIVSRVQTKVSKLTDLVSLLEEDMSSINEKNSDMEINNSDSIIQHLNQKVNGFSEQSEEQPQSSLGILENGSTAVVTKQATANKSLDNLQPRLPALEKKKPSETTVKKASAEKQVQVQNKLLKQSQSSADVSKNKIKTDATKQTNINKFKDKQQAKSKDSASPSNPLKHISKK